MTERIWMSNDKGKIVIMPPHDDGLIQAAIGAFAYYHLCA
jgi:hypothetical protein